MKRRILLFDVDGTLLDPMGIGRIFFKRALEDVYGIAISVDGYDMAGKTDWQILTEVLRLNGLKDERIEALRMEAFQVYAQNYLMIPSTYQMHRLPGVKDILEELTQDESFILGLVTGNVREIVAHKLRFVGVDPSLFKFGAFGSEHIDRNTLPALALYRLGQMLGAPVPLESVLVIGDTPLDIECARRARLKVLSVATGHFDLDTLGKYHPDYLLEDLSDTDAVMEILRSF